MNKTRTAQAAFVSQAARVARAVEDEFGVPAAVTLAQAALESNWGRAHMDDANNYFGIKAYDRGGVPQIGPIAKGFVTLPTREVVNGRTITVNARFRSYASMADSFRDHANFLRVNSRYAPAFAHTDEPDEFARAIARVGLRHRPGVRGQADRADAGARSLQARPPPQGPRGRRRARRAREAREARGTRRRARRARQAARGRRAARAVAPPARAGAGRSRRSRARSTPTCARSGRR